MFIKVEETPNPNTLKFIPEKEIDFKGTKLFEHKDNFENSFLLREIFAIQGVKSVLLNSQFIAVSKTEKEEWGVLKTMLTAKIGTALQNDKKPFDKQDNKKKDKSFESPVIKEIIDLLESKVKPAVASHGGDITFHSYIDGIVSLELKGSCSGCPSSTATLKMGIENMLKHYIPEIKEVIEFTP